MRLTANSDNGGTLFERLYGITEPQEAQLGKSGSGAKSQFFVEQPGGMLYIANLDSNASLLYVSQKIEGLLGFTCEQWRKDPELRIRQLYPDDRSAVLNAIHEAVLKNREFSIDYRITTRDGDIRWFHDEARIITNASGIPLFLQGVILDITDRKQAQTELECSHQDLQKMILVLDSLREEEQKRLAQEMHDELGQLLAAMKMDLSVVQQRLPQGDAKLLQALNSINELVDTMVASVRRIIADLPPKVLEDLGLIGALELLLANFGKRHQLACALKIPQPEPVLERKLTTPIYRMVQEALNNIAKHAQATRVDVQLDCHQGHLRLRITDNGAGISRDELKKHGSFGLIGMRERANALGGEMKIESTESAGTTIDITVPVAPSYARRPRF
jgi:two-component system sensor histidine kinase UhpB